MFPMPVVGYLWKCNTVHAVMTILFLEFVTMTHQPRHRHNFYPPVPFMDTVPPIPFMDTVPPVPFMDTVHALPCLGLTLKSSPTILRTLEYKYRQ